MVSNTFFVKKMPLLKMVDKILWDSSTLTHLDQVTHISGMGVFSFLTDFRGFFLSPRTIFITDQNALKCSKWLFMFQFF